MADPVAHNRLLSFEEYFAFEDASPVRHEYVDGEVYAMTGVTRRHSRIEGNIAARLWTAVRGGECRLHTNSVRVQIGSVIYYPDVMVACGPELDDERLEDAPCLVVEVLSPSTEMIDRREKGMVYKRLPSLGAYLIVEQERRLVERYWRDADGGWRHATIAEHGDVPIPFPPMVPPLILTLDEIYEGVKLPSAAERLRLREEELVYR